VASILLREIGVDRTGRGGYNAHKRWKEGFAVFGLMGDQSNEVFSETR